MIRRVLAVLVAGCLAFAQNAQACTGILLTAKDGSVVAARTLEFGFDLKSNVLVIPAGTKLAGSLPDGSKGLEYTTKYGMVGANAVDLTVIVDGINDQGLYVGLFYFPGYASYAEATKENSERAMAPQEYGTWLLGNFATVDEVKANFDKVALVPVIVEALKEAPPLHFVVRDRTGKSVVIEPIDKGLKLHDDPLGVVTNSPTFDWHITNLRNYVNLTATNVPRISLGDIQLAQTGQGSGMLGLPGDFSPPSRFVRAVAFSQAALPTDNAAQAVLQAFHILNNFDIPIGAVRETHEGKLQTDYTVWTAASDLENLHWHYRTHNDQSIRRVDLATAIAAADGKVRVIKMDSQQPISDVSTKFE